MPEYKAVDLSKPRSVDLDERYQREAIEAGDNYFFYRYEPRLDIDNDGIPDDVIVWKETGPRCGRENKAGGPIISRSYILILDQGGGLDMARTRKVFDHPMGATLAIKNSGEQGGTRELRSQRFRAIGSTLGALKFQGETYFDTFYAEGGDLENRRDGTPNYLDTLAVMKHRGGKTHLICEIEFSANDQKSNERAQP